MPREFNFEYIEKLQNDGPTYFWSDGQPFILFLTEQLILSSAIGGAQKKIDFK